MKPQLAYVDQDNAGAFDVPAGHIGLSPDGYHHHRNYSTIPLLAAPVMAAWFVFSEQYGKAETNNMGTLFICVLASLFALVAVGAVSYMIHQRMERSLIVKDVVWFSMETLGLTDEQRIDFALDIETAQTLRSPELQRSVCAKLQEIHEHAAWLTQHQDNPESPEFQKRRQDVFEAMNVIGDEIQQEVVRT